MRLKVSSAKWRPCCLGLNVLRAARMPGVFTIVMEIVIGNEFKIYHLKFDLLQRWHVLYVVQYLIGTVFLSTEEVLGSVITVTSNDRHDVAN